ncbi:MULTISPECIES: MFS transporter [Streptomyces]|uniref:MFS transporter n=1 Tax=Streptomyces morookaense TaxID=1970 RepID=A0A7Y7B379_STRMO|nr:MULTISPECIES: MFS transporter [Streptomyces]MCC2279550.1 MFS transporter [Streptomyces sp. ET3-23]NVK78055.1 MFS transporter [Streptomyces morookaense]GHF16060.1 MFS transporter [Streptomyces morookaense]
MSTPIDRPDPRRWWALGALVACMLVLGFDTTILTVALPTMTEQLGATSGEQEWIADSYLVVLAALMLPAGLLGDRFGRRRMLLTGLGIFLAGSLLGTLATNTGEVIAARTVLGAGAALIMPLALSVLPSLFPGEERTKAVGAVSAASALGLPLGPIIGGWLLDHYWWGSAFLVNVPLVIIGIAACLFLLPETSDPSSPRVDAFSTVLTTTGLGALVFGVVEGPTRGWSAPAVLGAFAAAAVLLTALVLRERRQPRPMLDLTLLAHRGFRWNTAAAALITFTLTGLLFVLPHYLQAVLGHDAFGTGLRMLPMMAGMTVAARTAAPLVTRFGPRTVIAGGLAVMAFAALLGSRTDLHDGYGFTALWLSVTGFGFGFGIIPAMDGALGTLPRERAGSGSGLLMTLRQVSGAVGVAVLGSLIAGAYRGRLGTDGLPPAAAGAARDSVEGAHMIAARLGDTALARSADAAYLHGMSLALLVCGIAALGAALLVAVRLPGGRPAEPAADHAVVGEMTDA